MRGGGDGAGGAQGEELGGEERLLELKRRELGVECGGGGGRDSGRERGGHGGLCVLRGGGGGVLGGGDWRACVGREGGRARVPVFIYTAREALCCCWLGCTCRGFAADLT